jgi:hypothetical protein
MKTFFLLSLLLISSNRATLLDMRGSVLLAHCCNPNISSEESSSSVTVTSTPETSFSLIYDRAHWGKSGGGSGEGSEPEAATGAGTILEHVLLDKDFKITSFADIGCGSFVWLPSVLDKVDAQRDSQHPIRFIGVDVVKSLMKRHTDEYLIKRPHWSFLVADASSASSSVIPANIDLLLCRDAIQHLPLMLAVQVLENLINSNSNWLLLSSYNVMGPNCDMTKPGYFSWTSLLKHPFLLPEPFATFEEGYESKRLLLYDRAKLKKVLDFSLMRERVLRHRPPIDQTTPCGLLPY